MEKISDKIKNVREYLQSQSEVNGFASQQLIPTDIRQDIFDILDYCPNFLKVSKFENPTTGRTLECIDKPEACLMLVTTEDMEEAIFVRQYRAGCRDTIYECPAGVVDPNMTPLDTVYKELREEIGLYEEDIKKVQYLGKYYSSVGWTSEICHLYIIVVDRDVEFHEQTLDEGENLTYEWLPIAHVKDIQTTMPIKTALVLNYIIECKSHRTISEKLETLETLMRDFKDSTKPKKRICMFGGSFNPLTNMHMAAAQRAIDELKLDKLIFMPVNSNYESKHDELISGADRINMIQGAISDSSVSEKFEVSDYEVNCISQPSTLETLRHLQSQYPDADIYFLIGSDNLKTISTWKGSTEILDEFQLIVTQREDTNIFQNVVLANKYLSTHSDSIHIIPEYVTSNISSTTVRNLIKAGRNIDWVVPPTVGKYIMEHGLYKHIIK